MSGGHPPFPDWHDHIEHHRPQRAKDLAALVDPTDPEATVLAQLCYLAEPTAAPAVLAECQHRRNLGMTYLDSMRSVRDDLHAGRWTP